MNELIEHLVEKTGLPADKAHEVLGAVAGFLKGKFPAFAGQIDSFLGSSDGNAAPGADNTGAGGIGGGLLGELASKLGF